jgi:hypothetical protein
MIVRAFLILLAVALPGVQAATTTYQRGENFDTAPKNWTYFHPYQFYGFQSTSYTGGNGEAGGIFQPKTYYNYYADTYLNGSLRRSNRIAASGRLAIQRVSANPLYTNSTYICHFNRGSNGFINTVGIALTGYNDSNVLGTAILEFSDGTAFIGDSVGITVPSSGYLEWSYTWDPNGGTQGFGSLTVRFGKTTSTINLTKTTAGLDFSLDAFGLFQPPFPAPNSNTFLQFEIGHLVYTALLGKAPTLNVHGPHKIKTTASSVVLSGAAKIPLGNRIQSVRYRVAHGGKVGKYRLASGTTQWSAKVKLPVGTSRIDVLATGDNGLTTTVSRKATRSP